MNPRRDSQLLEKRGEFTLKEMRVSLDSALNRVFKTPVIYGGFWRGEMVCAHTKMSDALAWLAKQEK